MTQSDSDEAGRRMVEIDSSEVEEFSLVCLDNCALCCLCQAELLGEENSLFSEDPVLRQGITMKNVIGAVTDNYFLCLKENTGSCYFLKDRRCRIYRSRPYYCRLFPVHIHVGDRVQCVANLSCRGLNDRGEGTRGIEMAGRSLEMAGLMGLEEIAEDKRLAYTRFRDSLIGGGEDLGRANLSSLAERLLKKFVFTDFVKRVLTYASSEDGVVIPLSELEAQLRKNRPLDPVDAALEGARDTFSDQVLTNIPAWTDEDMRWTVCTMDDEYIVKNEMDDQGKLVVLAKKRLKEVGLRPPGEAATRIMASYAMRLARRDLTYGYAAYLLMLEPSRDKPMNDFLKVYFGTLGTILLDYWWRTSLIAAFKDKTTIDAETAREGIIAYDMDYLDLPSLGGFL